MRYQQLARLLAWHMVPPPDDPPAQPPAGGGAPAVKPPRKAPKPEKPISDVVAQLIRSHGDANTALAVLAGEAKNYRRRLSEKDERIEELESAGAQAGGKVLTPAEKVEWDTYVALGKAADVKAKVERVGTLETQAAERATADLLATVATSVAPGVTYKASVLTDFVKKHGLHVELRDTQEKVNGVDTTVKRPYVRLEAKKDEPLTPLKEWVEKNDADYVPSLTATGQPGQPGTSGVAFHPTQQVPPVSNGQAGNLLDKRIERMSQQASAGNALMPAPEKKPA